LRHTTTSVRQPTDRGRSARGSRCALVPLGLILALPPVAAGAGPARPATLGEAFVLRIGEAAELTGERLELCFGGVRSDSRCPEGVKCFWAGDAVVVLDAQIPDAPDESIELHTAGGARRPRDARVHGFLVQLVQLEPGNRTGGVRAEEYRLTLRVTRAADQ